jgi:predicted kinase
MTVKEATARIRGLRSSGTETYAKTRYNQKSMLNLSLKSINRQIVY